MRAFQPVRKVANIMRLTISSLMLLLTTIGAAFSQTVGEEWTGRRGDSNPGLQYNALTTTPTGRLIAVGDGGSLMISDNGGTNWDFRQIKVDGVPVFGTFSAIISFNGSIIALMAEMVDATGGELAYMARTSVLRSSNNGETWTRTTFPFPTIDFRGRTYYGVHLTGLAISTAGELLAYGTTTVSNNFVIYWNVGGAIYRSADGSNWTEASFAYGPLSKIATAGGRLVATGFSTALDSADGSGWAGYRLTDAAINDADGTPLPFETLRRLRLTDVAFSGGKYVAQAVKFVPFNSFIDTSIVESIYTLVGPNPFDGSRSWTAYPQSRFFGTFLPSSTSLQAVGPGAFRSTNSGQSFSPVDATVLASSGSVTRSDASTLVAVGSSAAAWKSTSNGSSWTKVWDKPAGPDLRLLGTFNGTVFGADNNDLYASEDNGRTWTLRAAGENGVNLSQFGNRLFFRGSAQAIRVSDDNGFTWQNLPIGGSSTASASHITQTPSGRIVIAASNSLFNDGTFFISDDGGQTWSPRDPGLGNPEVPRAVLTTATGRIIVATNQSTVFEPFLLISDDNGDTWRRSAVLRSLDGLDPVTNNPSDRAFQAKQLRLSPTGRIVLLGQDELLTSDDDGETWTVRKNLGEELEQSSFLNVGNVVYTGERWVAVLSFFSDAEGRRKSFSLTSDDDGTTWRQVPIPVRQQNTGLYHLAVGQGGSLIAGGNNGAIYTSDAAALAPPASPTLSVREGTVGEVAVSRPPLPGSITARFSLVARTAVANRDFVSFGSELAWGAGDTAPKMVAIETIDNSVRNGERSLALQLEFETEDAKGVNEIPIAITDDDGTGRASVLFEGAEALFTSEAGGTATLRIALGRAPTADVVLTVTQSEPTEGSLSANAFTFTPANWNVQQTLVITGVDDSLPDGDRSYDIRFASSSADTAYEGIVSLSVSVVNAGDEPYDSGAAPLPTPTPTPTPGPTPTVPGSSPSTTPVLDVPRKVTGRNSKARIKGTLSGNFARVEVKAGQGGFQKAKIRGNRFIFKARNLPDRKVIKAKVRATASSGIRLTDSVKIVLKPAK